MMIATLAEVNTRLRNIFGSITGTSARLVLTTKAVAATAAAIQLATILPEPHPQLEPFKRPSEIAATVRMIITLPNRSGMRVVRS